LAAGDGKVIAGYDDELVLVTSRCLVPLVTRQGLASALHRHAVLIMGLKNVKVDADGDVYFFVLTLIRGRYGCQSRSLELSREDGSARFGPLRLHRTTSATETAETGREPRFRCVRFSG